MKCISVPVNTDAMDRLEYDECTDGDLVEVLLDEDNYNQLWNTGVFNLLNDKLDKNIDDYEDERIIGLNDLYQARMIINEKILSNPTDDVLNKLLSQVNLAINFNTGIFFYF